MKYTLLVNLEGLEFTTEHLLALYKLYNNVITKEEFTKTFQNNETTARQLADTIQAFTDERDYLQFLGKILSWDQPTNIEYAYIGRPSLTNSQWGRISQKIRKMYLRVLQEYPQKIDFTKPIGIYHYLQKHMRENNIAERFYIISGFTHCFLNRTISDTAELLPNGTAKFMLSKDDLSTSIKQQWFTREYSSRHVHDKQTLHNSRRFIIWTRGGYTDRKQASYNSFATVFKELIDERVATEFPTDADAISLYREKFSASDRIQRY
jgi:hypothetical protein